MRHLNRPAPPVELTQEVIDTKKAIYMADNDQAVWKETYIENALLSMSHDKCCYCECSIKEESKYMEIDHFHDRHDYPDEVMDWNNLLPSCKKCNGTKGTYDTVTSPIIDPSVDFPQNHLSLYNGVRFRNKDDKGFQTIIALDLNNQDRHCTPRYMIVKEINSKMESFHHSSEEFIKGLRVITPQGVGRLRNNVLELMQKGDDDKVYCSIAASAILNDPIYPLLKSNLQSLSSWTQEMEELESKMLSYKFDVA